MNYKYNNRNGFTLVELSIVLVIIGLLIGGILVAQSMIRTVKIQSTVRQLAQFDAAVNNFITKYNYLPGDTPIIGTIALSGGAGLGDQNWFLADGTNATEVTNFAGEIGTFWNALSLSGFSTNNAGTNGNTYVQAAFVPPATISNTGSSANIPKSIAGASGAGFVAFGASVNGANANWYGLISTQQYTGSAYVATSASNSALIPSDAAAIDAKIDDGIANSGNVRGGSTSAASGPSIVIDPACQGSSAAVYGSVSTYACDVMIRIGIQSGTPY